MPRKIVDLSALSKIIRDEPFHLHFWECSRADFLRFLKSPRAELKKIGIKIPNNCRIETTIENHDWIEANTNGLKEDDGTIVCNVGGGNVARTVYRIISYGHKHDSVGKYRKSLLHNPKEQERKK